MKWNGKMNGISKKLTMLIFLWILDKIIMLIMFYFLQEYDLKIGDLLLLKCYINKKQLKEALRRQSHQAINYDRSVPL